MVVRGKKHLPAIAQTLDSTLTLPRYTTGAGDRAYLVVHEAQGTGAQNLTISYTNQDGVSGRSLGYVVSNTALSTTSRLTHSGVTAGNYGPFLPLQACDTEIRSVQSITLSSAATAGTAVLVLCRPIMTLPIMSALIASERDYVNQLPSMPRIYDGAFLNFLFYAGAATAAATTIQGYIDFAWS